MEKLCDYKRYSGRGATGAAGGIAGGAMDVESLCSCLRARAGSLATEAASEQVFLMRPNTLAAMPTRSLSMCAKPGKGSYASLGGNKHLRGVPMQTFLGRYPQVMTTSLCEVNHACANLPTQDFWSNLRKLYTRIERIHRQKNTLLICKCSDFWARAH